MNHCKETNCRHTSSSLLDSVPHTDNVLNRLWLILSDSYGAYGTGRKILYSSSIQWLSDKIMWGSFPLLASYQEEPAEIPTLQPEPDHCSLWTPHSGCLSLLVDNEKKNVWFLLKRREATEWHCSNCFSVFCLFFFVHLQNKKTNDSNTLTNKTQVCPEYTAVSNFLKHNLYIFICTQPRPHCQASPQASITPPPTKKKMFQKVPLCEEVTERGLIFVLDEISATGLYVCGEGYYLSGTCNFDLNGKREHASSCGGLE